MTRLPEPGPGRPHHASYSEPQRGMSLLELLIWILAFAFAGGLWMLGEAVL